MRQFTDGKTNMLNAVCMERGITTVVVLLILLVLSLIAIAGMTVSTTEIRIAGNQYRSTQSLHAADAGRRAATQATVNEVRTFGHPPGYPPILLAYTVPPPSWVSSASLPSGPGGAMDVSYQVAPVVRNAWPYAPPGDDYKYIEYTIPSTGSGPGSTQKGVEFVVAVLYQEGYEWP
jgi:hypothetical protein